MKTTFVRQFLLTAVLILFSIVVVGAAFHSLLFNHLTAEEEDSLQTNANAVADLAAAYDTSGELEENWNFRMSLTFAVNTWARWSTAALWTGCSRTAPNLPRASSRACTTTAVSWRRCL